MNRRRTKSFPHGERLERRHCLSSVAYVATSDITVDGLSSLALADLDHDGDLDVLAEGIGPPGGGYPLSWVERIDAEEIFANADFISVGAGSCASQFEPVRLRGDDTAVGVIVGVTGDSFCPPLSDGPSIGFLDRFEGEWRYTHLLDTEGTVWSIRVADVDGDGDKDIVAIHDGGPFQENPPGLVWSQNTGGGDLAFGDWKVIDDEIEPYAHVAVVDLNGDQKPDLLTWPWGHGAITWYENNGLDFEEQTFATGASHQCRTVEVADVDGDLDLDVVAKCRLAGDRERENLVWYENNGQGLFDEEHLIDEVHRFDLVIAEDVDGNGTIDVLSIPDGTWDVIWYSNTDGIGDFEPKTLVELPLDELIRNVLAGDADGDGDVDLLIGLNEDAPNVPRRVVLYESRLIGDSDDNGNFDSSDLVAVFQAGKYEDGIPDNASFDEGDWNQDGEFDSSDLVLAFQAGHYEHETLPMMSKVAAAVDWLFAQDQRDTRHRAWVA